MIDTPDKLRSAVNVVISAMPVDNLEDALTVLGATTAWMFSKIEDDRHRAMAIDSYCKMLREEVPYRRLHS